MAIQVTITKVLEDWWGADEVPPCQLEELCREDIFALLENSEWAFHIVDDSSEPIDGDLEIQP